MRATTKKKMMREICERAQNTLSATERERLEEVGRALGPAFPKYAVNDVIEYRVHVVVSEEMPYRGGPPMKPCRCCPRYGKVEEIRSTTTWKIGETRKNEILYGVGNWAQPDGAVPESDIIRKVGTA